MWGSETHGLLIHDAGQRQNKNIILCYKLSPLSELMHLFFVHFISLFNVQRNELYLFAKAPSPEPNWKTFEENAFLKKKENKQKVIFFFFFVCMFCCPICFVSPGHSINLFIVKRKKEFLPHNAQTIEMAHLHEHWTCASFISLLVQRLAKYKVKYWRT